MAVTKYVGDECVVGKQYQGTQRAPQRMDVISSDLEFPQPQALQHKSIYYV